MKREGWILLAIRDLQNSKIISIRTAAVYYQIPRRTLTHHLQNVQSRTDTRPNGHKLTILEGNILIEWILSLDFCSAVSRPSYIRDIANILLDDCENILSFTVDINWATFFINHRDKLQLYFSRQYSYQRTKNKDRMVLFDWFSLIKQTINQNRIQPDNIYNFDKTGFAIDFISIQKIVIQSDLYNCRAILQSGNHK